MSRVFSALCVAVVLAAVPSLAADSEAPLSITSHPSSETSAHVNAHLLQGGRDAVLVDEAMTVADAASVADMVERSGRRLVWRS